MEEYFAWYISTNKNQPDALLILYLFCNQPLHISGMLLPIIRRYHCTVYIQQTEIGPGPLPLLYNIAAKLVVAYIQ
jgi:hypothetical protein